MVLSGRHIGHGTTPVLCQFTPKRQVAQRTSQWTLRAVPGLASRGGPASNIRPRVSTPLTNLTLSPALTLPYAQDWDLNLQQSFGSDWLFEIGYVGTKGTRLPRFIEANPAVFVPGTSNGQPISNSSNADQRRLYSGCTLADPPSSCQFSSTGEIAGIANSSYNALEASLRKRFSHGLSFLASYTWSKAIDNVSSFNITGSASKPVAGENDLAQDPFNLAAERGLSAFDARNRFVGSGAMRRTGTSQHLEDGS
jgi:hypothetical protein